MSPKKLLDISKEIGDSSTESDDIVLAAKRIREEAVEKKIKGRSS